jgi:transposase-like protein
MGEALAVMYPATTLRTCIVHLIRNSLDPQGVGRGHQADHTAASAEAALAELDAFAQGPWGAPGSNGSCCLSLCVADLVHHARVRFRFPGSGTVFRWGA